MAETLFGITVSIHKINDSNALLLYKVGPVLVCSPTLYVESITIPPNLNSLPGANDAEPGMFKSMHGMVRVVDLRVRFGVDVDDRKSPGRIIISETTGGYVGLWVDEIEDVIGFPEKGWSQLPVHVPREAFSRTLICDEGIRLYADIENLDKFKATGYLRTHIENIKSKEINAKKQGNNNVEVEGSVRRKIESEQEEKLVKEVALGEKNVSISDDSQVLTKPVLKPIKNVSKNTNGNKSRDVKSSLSNVKVANEAVDKKVKKGSSIKAERVLSASTPDSRSKIIPSHKKSVSFSSDKAISAEIKQVQGNDSFTLSKGREKESEQIKKNAEGGFLWPSVIALSFIAISVYVVEFSGVFDVNVSSVSKDANRNNILHEINNSTALNEPNDRSVEREAASNYENDKVDISSTDEGITIVINDYERDFLDDESRVDINNNENGISENNKTENIIELDAEKIEIIADVEGLEVLNKEIVIDSKAEKMIESSNVGLVHMEDDFGLVEEELVTLSHKEIPKDEALSKVVKTITSIHVVVTGDTLWGIAKRYVNDPWQYPELARLSKIKDPDLIYPGQKVTIIYNTNK